MRPYTDAVLSPLQKYFNYQLSRSRNVTEGAYGQLNGSWRVLLRKNECDRDLVSLATLASMILDNICIEQGDSLSKKLDLTFKPDTLGKRTRNEIKELLQMTDCPKIKIPWIWQKERYRCTLSKSVVRERNWKMGLNGCLFPYKNQHQL